MGTSFGVDRLVAIGTTVPGVSLRHLELGRSFKELVDPYREGRDLGGGPPTSVPQKWTAASTSFRIESERA